MRPRLSGVGDACLESLSELPQPSLAQADAIESLQQVGIHICHSIELFDA